MNDDTPETNELIRSLDYEKLASPVSCYAQMREHARNLERDRDEQCRLLGMSAERECDLRGELERERALADRLAGLLELYFWKYEVSADHTGGISKALAEWKEARSE